MKNILIIAVSSAVLTGCLVTPELTEVETETTAIKTDTVYVQLTDTVFIQKIDSQKVDLENTWVYAQREGRMKNYWEKMSLPCTLRYGQTDSQGTKSTITFTNGRSIIYNEYTVRNGEVIENPNMYVDTLYSLGLDDNDFYNYKDTIVNIGKYEDYGKIENPKKLIINSCFK